MISIVISWGTRKNSGTHLPNRAASGSMFAAKLGSQIPGLPGFERWRGVGEDWRGVGEEIGEEIGEELARTFGRGHFGEEIGEDMVTRW